MKYLIATALSLFTCASFLALPKGTIFMILGLILCVTTTNGQTLLLLPAPSQFVQGEGECSDLVIGIHSENWRVRNGDIFEVGAVQRIVEHPNLHFEWTVANGKIASGQHTSKVNVKAGGRKAPGYINVSGFVGVHLLVKRIKHDVTCEVKATTSIMVGRHREMNRVANVNDLILDRSKFSIPCPDSRLPHEAPNASDELIVNVTTVANDPENDVLFYSYAVSAGKVIGNGSKVTWNVKGLPPGNYSIEVGVDDGFGIFGKTQRRTITITDCKQALVFNETET